MSRTVILFIILVICLFIAGVVWLNDHISISSVERQYQKTGSDADLAGLCIHFYIKNDHKGLVKYIPKAIQIDNIGQSIAEWAEASEAMGQHDGLDKLEGVHKEAIGLAVEQQVLSESDFAQLLQARFWLAYIYEGQYQEYKDIFPVLYDELLDNYETLYLAYEVGLNKERINEEGWKIFVSEFEEACLDMPVYPESSYEDLMEYGKNMMAQIVLHDAAGKTDKANKIYEEYNKALEEYRNQIRANKEGLSGR